ncbi:MAG TPA: ABC transporter substrate-binding protein [Acidimicrobiales bacterium]|nr:ABC transporter substrate-binding protein [Acidimicrobiales bacterium]
MGRRDDRSGRVRKLIALLLILASVAAACGGGDDGGDDAGDEPTGTETDISDQGEPVDGGSISVGLEAETSSWLPGSGNFANSGVSVAYAIYDPLMRRNSDGVMTPYLAESVTPSDDLLTWTVKLRPDVLFHDGTPLDSAAMKTIFDQYLKAPGANTAAPLADVQLNVVDDLTYEYKMSKPNSAFGDNLGLAIGWPFSPTAAAAAGADAGSKPVGTGPFVFDTWERDSRLVVKKNPNYWQEGLPHLDEITFRPIPDEDTRLSSLESGDIDVLQSLRQSTAIKAREVDGVDNYEALGNTTGVTIFNTRVPPLDDVRVREALVRGADQEQLIEIQGGTGVVPPSTQLFAESDPYWSKKVADAWPEYDPEAATELIQEYVDDPQRSDGKAPGEPVSFRYDCLPDPALVDLAQLYQSLWQTIGVEVELRQVEQATHVNEALQADFQAKCFRAGLERDPAPTLRDAFTPGTLNFTGLNSPELTAMIDELAATSDVEQRKQIVEDISLTVNEAFPMAYYGSTLAVLAARDDVKGIDAWTFPDGTEGSGVPGGTTHWAFVWKTQ